jgi:DNA-binding transcriptional regulator YiaG
MTPLQKALAETTWTDREIADEFEVAVSTVRRWKSGVARPMPSLVKLIIKTLKNKEHI